MVDVVAKAATLRRAVAQAVVRFPPDIAAELQRTGLRGKKGAIVDTAIVAGTMAAKRTHELIPFCHPLALERWNEPSDTQGRCRDLRRVRLIHGQRRVVVTCADLPSRDVGRQGSG